MGVFRSHHPAGLVAALALALGGTGCFGGDQHAGIPLRPVIRTFAASPGSISPGGTTTLSWSATGATSLAIDNGVGDVTGTTSKVVSPATTTTYTLTASNGTTTSTATVTVTVGTTPVISSFAANPTTIATGGSSTLSWAVTGATSLSIDNGV